MTTTPSNTPNAEPAADDNSERGKSLRAAYGAATTRLRESHREEFDRFYEEEARNRGIDYKRKPTPQEKAEQELAELLEKFPHLRETMVTPEPEAEVKEFKTS